MADAHETLWQDMQSKTTRKLFVGQCYHPFFAFPSIIFVLKSYLFIINGLNALIADSHFVGISPQIFYYAVRIAERTFGIHHPIFLEQSFRKGVGGNFFAPEFFYIFGAKHTAQSLDGKKIFSIEADVFPPSVFIRAPTRNDAVLMRMKAQILSRTPLEITIFVLWKNTLYMYCVLTKTALGILATHQTCVKGLTNIMPEEQLQQTEKNLGN